MALPRSNSFRPKRPQAKPGVRSIHVEQRVEGEEPESHDVADHPGMFPASRVSGLSGSHSHIRLIADPGDGEAIPVEESGYVPLVTVAAETRTLADAAMPGLTLDLYLKKDGGNCIVTAASDINQSGDNVMTFDTAGEHIRLVSIEDGTDYEWRIVANDGVGLT